MKIVISNLRVKMAERGLTIKDVNQATLLSRTTISNLYNGYSDGIKFHTLEKLCELFNCYPNDLLRTFTIDIVDIEIKKETSTYNYMCQFKLIVDGTPELKEAAIKLDIMEQTPASDGSMINWAEVSLNDVKDILPNSLNIPDNHMKYFVGKLHDALLDELRYNEILRNEAKLIEFTEYGGD